MPSPARRAARNPLMLPLLHVMRQALPALFSVSVASDLVMLGVTCPPFVPRS